MVGRMDGDASEAIGFSEPALVMLMHPDIWLRFCVAFQPVAILASARDSTIRTQIDDDIASQAVTLVLDEGTACQMVAQCRMEK